MKEVIKNLFLFVICSLGLNSCFTPSKTEIIRYNIKALQNSNEYFHFEDSLTYIPLETNTDCLVGEIYKVILTSNYIFILSNDVLYQFDSKGLFVRKIGTLGKGPGEYTTILDVSVDEIPGNIYLYDNSTGKVLIYDMSGKYLDQYIHKELWWRFEVINNIYSVWLKTLIFQNQV